MFIGQATPDARVRSYLSAKVGYPGSGWINERELQGKVAEREVLLRVVRKGASRFLVATWYEASPGLAVESARALFSLDSSPLWKRERVPLALRLSTPLLSAEPAAIEKGRLCLDRFAERLSPALKTLSTPRES